MNALSLSSAEHDRLQILQQYEILDTPPEQAFDELAKLAAQVSAASMAVIAFIDERRVWHKAQAGVRFADQPREEMIYSTLLQGQEVLLEDALGEPRFKQSRLVTDGRVRFFAGIPLQAMAPTEPEGTPKRVIGLLAVMHPNPMKLDGLQLDALRSLSRQIVSQLELRKTMGQLRRSSIQAENALKQSEAFYHSLVETLPQNIFRKDLSGRFTFANTKFCETVRRPLNEIIGKTDYDLFPQALAEKYMADDTRVITDRAAFTTTEQHQDHQGNRLFVQVIKSPIYDSSGQLVGIQGVFWDETERYETEAALARERELLRAMLDNIPDSIYFKDRRSTFLMVSRSLAIRLGLTGPEEAIGKTDADFFSIEHARQTFDDEQRIMATGQPLVAKPERELWNDGTERWVLSTKVPLRQSDGEIIGTFGISKDITELKVTERELSKARDVALESARLKSEFLANMSHEIRTPLNAVIGMTGLMLETELSTEQRDFTETIRRSADALLAIINDILDFSKIEAGKMPIEIIEFDLTEVVEGTAELLAEAAQAKGIELASWIHEEVPRRLRGDPGRLRQVLTNLVGNAVKFTPRGEVLIDVTRGRESEKTVVLKFSVRDTGIGIPEEARSRLFHAFTQADGSTTRRYGGTGLGLAISRQLVELMHGDIGFESQVGRGSTFWFSIPFEKQVEQDSAPAVASTLEGLRVLVVDDNETNRAIVHHQVLGWKMRNGSADRGEEALRMMREAADAGDPYRVVILDMQMPEMDGLTLARRIKEVPALATAQLVMLTSLGYLPEERQWRECGISAYLIKPVKEQRLYETLVQVMRGTPRELSRFPAAKSSAGGTARNLRILIAEDNVVNQKVTLRQLQKLGHSADAVANGIEAIDAIERFQYDVILMDCQMPELDGYGATRLIRKRDCRSRNGRPLYVVAMTANALSGDRDECLAAGMDDYISKPVRLSDLQEALNRAQEKLTEESNSSVLDKAVIDGIRELRSEGESDPLIELVGLFEEDTPGHLEAMAQAQRAKVPGEIERAAHALKGSASNIGASRMAQLCAMIMEQSRSGAVPEFSLIERLGEEFRMARAALQEQIRA